MSIKGKILIIDDEEVIRDVFKRFLSMQGYEFYSASNGVDGLKLIKEVDPDLVFLDLKMPGMDGFEVLKKSKDINKNLPVIILTGHGDLGAAIQTVKLGAYDFMQKPIEDLEALLVDIQRAIENHHLAKKNMALTEELTSINKELENKVKKRTEDLENILIKLKTAQTKIQEEIKTVSLVQQNLLPAGPPQRKGLDAAAIYLASAATGGDYYDYLDMGDEKLGVVIADVSGHGLPAAFVMTMVKVVLIYLNEQNIPMQNTVRTINDMLAKHIPTNNFVTMIYGILNFKEMKFTFINAGHEPLIHLSSNGKKLQMLTAKSPFLGIDPGIDFAENTLYLEKGDKLVFYTDGVTEACNIKKDIFGQERFNAIVTESLGLSSMELISNIISELSSHCEGTSYADDITMMVLGLS